MLEDDLTLPLIYDLLKSLEAEKVAYCHWKSNNALDRSMRGENDLDLLIDRASKQRFSEVLVRLGFKEAQSSPRREIPGIVDYYGYDQTADKLVHVHAHYQLVLGHDSTKNFHLPIEKPYIESAVQRNLLKIPAPEFELIVFVIRMLLKHSTWDVILVGQGELSESERQEFRFLQNHCDYSAMHTILEQHLPCVDANLFDSWEKSLQPSYSRWKRIKAGWQLQRCLKAHARRGQISEVFLKIERRVNGAIQRRLFGQMRRKQLKSGGLMIAIVGGDGSGKSTTIDELYAWLSSHFNVVRIHMGKPKWSRTTFFVRGMLKIGQALGLWPFVRVPFQYTDDANSLEFPGFPWLIRQVCTARDRYLTYIKARCSANKGALVICDRFPLAQAEFMDAPQGEKMMKQHAKNLFVRALINLEKKCYHSILAPELLIVLRIDPEIAVQRKLDENPISVRFRSGGVWKFDWRPFTRHTVDASETKEQMITRIKSIIWEYI